MIQDGADSAPASPCLLPCLSEWEKSEDNKLEELLFFFFFKLVKLKSIKEGKEMSVIKVRVMVTRVSVIVIPHLEMVPSSTRLCSACLMCISSCNSYNNSARQARVLI